MRLGSFQDYQIDVGVVTGRPDKKPAKPRKEDKRFLKAPLPWNWLCSASRLPGKTLNVAVALRFIAGIKKDNRIKMQGAVLKELGISRQTYNNGLKQLERAGLVTIEKGPGQTPIVTLVDL